MGPRHGCCVCRVQVTKEREKEISDDEAEDEEKEEKKDADDEDKDKVCSILPHLETTVKSSRSVDLRVAGETQH